MGEWVSKGPCPHCPSSDAYATHEDGHGYCFSCEAYDRVAYGGEVVDEFEKEKKDKSLIDPGEYRALPSRRITVETCRKYGYSVSRLGGQTVHVAPYYAKGKLAAQHLRTADKDFYWRGNSKDVELFGQHLWAAGGKRIIITEGEIDCLTMAQAFGLKWPVVSIPSGVQGAYKALQRHLEYIDSFDEIVLAFDNDEPGREGVEKCAPLFTPGKVKIYQYPSPDYKDPNQMLVDGLTAKEICVGVWNAQPYQPDGIVSGDALWEAVSQPVEMGLSYPWKTLTELTYGIRLGELIGLGAGTGLGKTEVFKEMALHLIVEHHQTVGLLFLEESNKDTMLALMGKYAKKRFHIPGVPYSEDEKYQAFLALKNNVHLWNHFGGTSYETIKSRLRYMVLGLGCKYVFLDHITALTSGDKDGDERKQIDYIMTDLASLVRELNFNLHFISHLNTPEGKPHEEGGRVMLKHLRGSRAIAQWSSFVFALERNQQEPDPIKRHISTFRILKDRYTGQATGEVLFLRYDLETGRLEECSAPDDEAQVVNDFGVENTSDAPF